MLPPFHHSIRKQQRSNPKFYLFDSGVKKALDRTLSLDCTPEVDFVLPFKNHLVPVEVKSGKTGTLKSLHQFINKSNVPFAVRFYKGQISVDDTFTPSGVPYKLINLPY